MSSFSRDARVFAAGGLLLSLFLAGLASVVLLLVASWGGDQWEARRTAETRLVADRLAASRSPALELAAGERRVAEPLFGFDAVTAALYAAGGERIADAGFLPGGGSSPPRLPPGEVLDSARAASAKRAADGVLIVTARTGAGTLRVSYRDPAAAALRRSSWVVPGVVVAGGLLLFSLLAPFLRRVLNPIDARAETARSAGPLVRSGEGGDRAGSAPDDDVALFRKTVSELRFRTEELERLRKQEQETARRQLEALGEVSAGVAHEFRNAAAALIGWLRLAGSGSEADRERTLGAARKEAEHVAAIAGDFLEFARPESVRPSDVDLAETAAAVVEEVRRTAPEVEFSLDVQPTRVAGDEMLLRRAISNLVRNAAEAAILGSRGGRVAVSVRPEDSGVLVEVEDDGAGLPAAIETDRLFLPFVTTKQEGSGLGLAIVARVAGLHEGSVEAGTSRTLGGARLTFRIRGLAGAGASVTKGDISIRHAEPGPGTA